MQSIRERERRRRKITRRGKKRTTQGNGSPIGLPFPYAYEREDKKGSQHRIGHLDGADRGVHRLHARFHRRLGRPDREGGPNDSEQ